MAGKRRYKTDDPLGKAAHDGKQVANPSTTCDDGYTEDELEFLKAMDSYKKKYNRPHPTWREVLEVVKSLGYSK